MIEGGKRPLDKKEVEIEDKCYALQIKIDSLKKIRKSKMHKYKNKIKNLSKQLVEVNNDLLGIHSYLLCRKSGYLR
jgi:polyhydroxyalkanoate synthesis regulator phasin